MAKKQDTRESKSRTDQVRAAVEGAFGATAQGAGPMRERAQELADELVGAASRFREVLEELRPPSLDELGALRRQVDELERRVAELEAGEAKPAAAAPKRAARAKPAPAKPPARAKAAAPAKPAAPASAEGAKGASASPGASTAKRGAAKRA